jgi:hypothetical protein
MNGTGAQLHSAMMQSRIRNDLSESSNAPQPSIKPAIARDAIVASVQDVNNSYANIRALHDADSRVRAGESRLCSVLNAPSKPPCQTAARSHAISFRESANFTRRNSRYGKPNTHGRLSASEASSGNVTRTPANVKARTACKQLQARAACNPGRS